MIVMREYIKLKNDLLNLKHLNHYRILYIINKEIKKNDTFKYAIVSNGNKVKGTRYNKAGCAALNTSELTVAVSRPRK